MNELADIRTMPAGPELDIAFARVVGIRDEDLTKTGVGFWYGVVGYAGLGMPWHPSTDTEQAFSWADKWLHDQGLRWSLERLSRNYLFGVDCVNSDFLMECHAETAPLAAVRGVLLVAESLKEKK